MDVGEGCELGAEALAANCDLYLYASDHAVPSFRAALETFLVAIGYGALSKTNLSMRV